MGFWPVGFCPWDFVLWDFGLWDYVPDSCYTAAGCLCSGHTFGIQSTCTIINMVNLFFAVPYHEACIGF